MLNLPKRNVGYFNILCRFFVLYAELSIGSPIGRLYLRDGLRHFSVDGVFRHFFLSFFEVVLNGLVGFSAVGLFRLAQIYNYHISIYYLRPHIHYRHTQIYTPIPTYSKILFFLYHHTLKFLFYLAILHHIRGYFMRAYMVFIWIEHQHIRY